MPSVLEEFAKDNISPSERFFKRDSEYGRAIKELCVTEEKLSTALNEPENALFEAFGKAQATVSSMDGNDRFVHGYKLGALFMLEIMESREELLYGAD